MKKVLFVSHVANFQKFNRPLMRYLSEAGYQVYYASAGEETIQDCYKSFSIAISRSPYSWRNIKGIWQLRKIIKQQKFALIHCHTPMGGVVARLANFLAGRDRTKIIYTAHGFHFFKGASALNWLVYYPAEKILSSITNAIITINREDFARAKRKLKTKTHCIDGVGVDLSRFKPINRQQKTKLRQELGYSTKDFVVVYVAEFIPRKNHLMLLRNFQLLRELIPNYKLVLLGKGDLLEKYRQKYSGEAEFVGYSNRVDDYFKLADLAVSPSFQEGLPINVIEAMASGLPVVASKIRGQSDLIKHGQNGYLFNLKDDHQMIKMITKLAKNPALRQKMGRLNAKLADKYSVDKAVQATAKIYREVLGEI